MAPLVRFANAVNSAMAVFNLTQTLQTAIRHHQAGRLPQAEALYREILAHDAACVDAIHYLGVIALQAGQSAAAVEWISRAAALAPNNAAVHSNLGEAYRHLGRIEEAVTSFQRALALQPDHLDALNNLGSARTAQGRLDEAISCFQHALVKQDSAQTRYNLAMALVAKKNFGAAIAHLQEAIALHSAFPAAYAVLGNLLKLEGRIDDAIVRYRQSLALDPNSAETHYNLGVALTTQKRIAEAVVCFRRALELNPGFAAAHNNLGLIFEQEGQFDDALGCFRSALTLVPQFTEAYYNLAELARRRGQFDEAIAAYERALALRPTLADAHNNLGVIHKIQGNFDAALAAYRCAIEGRPDFVDAHNNLGNLLKEQGSVTEAIDHYRKALALQPTRPDIHSNLIFALHYDPTAAPDRIEAELQLWNELHARPLAAVIAPHRNERSSERRLRIGYVSPDFCRHAVGFNLVPLFEHHAHETFEIVCYSDVPRDDPLTAQFRKWSDQWRDVSSQPHARLAELIRQDSIDILVDLALHTANNRLPVFARKPAPVQVSFAGYPGRTGLETIDAHLTDPYLSPRAIEVLAGPDVPFALPNTFWCYAPPSTDPAVGPLPARTNGYVTFGCLNNFGKVNPATLQLWARVLSAVPQSRLVLLSALGGHRTRVLTNFQNLGVSAERIDFIGLQSRQNYLAAYHRIDVGLDTLPYNGHTTSLDSYWMGVPVVTLVGKTTVGRAGWSQLSNLRLIELAAHSSDEFVGIAVTLAQNLSRLTEMRASLRERMRGSPLMNGPAFARDVENAYRVIWCRQCGRTP